MRSFLIIIFTLALASCGAPKTTATLKLVKGFSASNVQEHGGIIIHGHNIDSGNTFTLSLPTGNSRSIDLPNGNWKFGAFSWDGGLSGPKVAFSGTARCAQAEAFLDGSNVEVDLSLTQSECSNMQTAFELRDFQLKTCGAFYVAPGMITPVNDASSDTDKNNLCEGAFPTEYKNRVKSYRLTALNNINSNISEGFSYCGDFPEAPDAALPFKIVPFKIQLFNDSGCRNLFSEFPLDKGINFEYENLDQLISNTHLILPSTRSRKGYSPFMGILPRMECGLADGNCLGPITSTPASRRIQSGPVGTEIKLLEKRGVDTNPCPSISSQGSFDLDCDYDTQEKRLSVRASLNNDDPCGTATSCTETVSIDVDGVTQSISIVIEDPQADRDSARIIANLVWGISGVHAINPNFLPYFQDKDSNFSDDDYTFKTKYGVLGSVRSMLGPDAVGGALSNYTCGELLTQVVTSEQIPVHEDNQVRYHRVRSIPGDASFPSDMGVGTTNLNLQLQLLESGTWETEQSYRLSCSSKLGYSYFRRVESDRSEYQKIYWNLVTAGSEKLEHYYLERETYSTRESMGAQRMHKNGSTDYSIRLVSIDASSTLDAKNSTVLELVHSGGSTLSFNKAYESLSYGENLSNAKDLSGTPLYTFPRTNIESYDFTGFGVVATIGPVSLPVWAPNSSILGPSTPLSPLNLDPTQDTFKNFMQTVTP